MSANCLRHDMLVHTGEDEFVGRIAPFLLAGVEAGESVLAVSGPATRAALQDELGSGREHVTFIDADTVYIRPEAALASYDRTLRALADDGARGIRGVAVLPGCDTVADWQRWIAYEAIVNRALAHHPAWIVCAYDTSVVDPAVVADMRRTHPEVAGDDACGCHAYEDPADVVRAIAPAAVPAPLPALRPLAPAADAPQFRAHLTAAMEAAGVACDRARDMLLAASEVFSNADRHGGGLRDARAGVVDGRFVCELSDHGPGIADPLTGYLPPHDGADGGFGMWVARQATERMDLLADPAGLTVRLWV